MTNLYPEVWGPLLTRSRSRGGGEDSRQTPFYRAGGVGQCGVGAQGPEKEALPVLWGH